MSSNRGYNNFREESQQGPGSSGLNHHQPQYDKEYRPGEAHPPYDDQRNFHNGPSRGNFRSDSYHHPGNDRQYRLHGRSRSPQTRQNDDNSRGYNHHRNEDRRFYDGRPPRGRGGPYRKADERREKYERLGIASVEDLAKVPAKAVVSEQQEKRKLLWGSSKKKTDSTDEPSTSAPAAPAPAQKIWQDVAFEGDNDGSAAQKFKKLMGIKEDTAVSTPQDANPEASTSSRPAVRQDELFKNLDMQYEKARLSAHTQRGLGLGFSRHV
ncbi:hypothetical protein RvY_15642 [Ramazzottius varieornatus]|uniref:Small acidic protein-like domain-containing protein n=1 Tax=Ramazzottius varieornatus TaxID=947166 RepID=A0A1D1W2E2_RAMVA|nr:hypothetical protein RvY_15642 [Ramazzottius varieornatus]